MIAAIYTRVSRDAKRNARSVQEQEKECRAWCARENHAVEGVWCDNDVSATRFARKDRPEWQELMEKLAAGGIDLLVVWEPSRATRDRRVWAALAALCEEKGIRFAVNGRVYDVNDPDDAFSLDLYFALAVREGATTKKRVDRAVRDNAEKGRPHGRILYGYTRVYDPATGLLVRQEPDEESRTAVGADGSTSEYSKAGIVREAARRVAAGEPRNAVARDLNARGIPSPSHNERSRTRGWDLMQIRRVVTNPGYIGKRVFQGKVIGDAAWAPILDEATFYTCANRVADTPSNLRAGTVVHVLSGIAKCGECGAVVRVINNAKSPTYACSRLSRKAPDGTVLQRGHCVGRKKEFVETLVTAAIIDRLSRPDAADLLTAPAVDQGLEQAVTNAAELQARLDAATDEYVAGNLSAVMLAKIEKQLQPKLEAAHKAAAQAKVVPILRDVVRTDLAEVWPTFSVDKQREIIAALMDIEILPTHVRNRTFDPNSVRITWRS